MTDNNTNKQDIYTRITNQIVTALEQGVKPWTQPWNAAHAAGHVSRPLRHNGQPYAGINVLTLWCSAMQRHYGHKQGLRRIHGEAIEMTEEEEATRAALAEEFDRLESEYADADELPEEIDQRLGELEEMIEALDDRPVRYEPADIARAGVFVSLDRDGSLYIERG